jgi:hypothetical protein
VRVRQILLDRVFFSACQAKEHFVDRE